MEFASAHFGKISHAAQGSNMLSSDVSWGAFVTRSIRDPKVFRWGFGDFAKDKCGECVRVHDSKVASP